MIRQQQNGPQEDVRTLLRDIITLQAALTRPLSSRDLLARACKFFQPRHYFDVIEERLVGARLCGYPPCKESVLLSPPMSSREVAEQAKREKEYAKSIRRGGRGQRTIEYRESCAIDNGCGRSEVGGGDEDEEEGEEDAGGRSKRDEDSRITERARLPDAERMQSYCSRRCFAASMGVLRQLSEVQPQSRLFDGQLYDLRVFPEPSTSELNSLPAFSCDSTPTLPAEVINSGGFDAQKELLRIQLGLSTGRSIAKNSLQVSLTAAIVERDSANAPLPPQTSSATVLEERNPTMFIHSKGQQTKTTTTTTSSAATNTATITRNSGGEEFVDLRAVREAKRAEKASKRLLGGGGGGGGGARKDVEKSCSLVGSNREEERGLNSAITALARSNMVDERAEELHSREIDHAATALVTAIQKVAEVYAGKEESKSSSSSQLSNAALPIQQLRNDDENDNDTAGFGLDDIREDLAHLFLAPTAQSSLSKTSSLTKPTSQKKVQFTSINANEGDVDSKAPAHRAGTLNGKSTPPHRVKFNDDNVENDDDEDDEDDDYSDDDGDEEDDDGDELSGGMWLNTPLDITGAMLEDHPEPISGVGHTDKSLKNDSKTKKNDPIDVSNGAIGFGRIEATAAFFAQPVEGIDVGGNDGKNRNSGEQKIDDYTSIHATGDAMVNATEGANSSTSGEVQVHSKNAALGASSTTTPASTELHKASTSSVIESVSQFRAFGVSSFGLLYSATSRWRSEGSRRALTSSLSSPSHGEEAATRLLSKRDASNAITVARMELVVSHLTRSIKLLSELDDSSTSSAFSLFARSLASNTRRVERLVDSFQLHSPVPLLTEREWQFMALAVLEAVRIAEEYGEEGTIDNNAMMIFAASKTFSFVLARGLSILSEKNEATGKSSSSSSSSSPSSPAKSNETTTMLSPSIDQIARLACIFLFGLDVDLDGTTTSSVPSIAAAKPDSSIRAKTKATNANAAIFNTERNSKATLAQVELELAMLKNVMR